MKDLPDLKTAVVEDLYNWLTNERTVECRYRCPCLQRSIPVPVRERGHDEPLLRWINSVVMQAVGRDHLTRSPQCRRGKVDLLMPVPNQGGIGTADHYGVEAKSPTGTITFRPVEEIDG